jgi:ubiquitin
MRTLPRLVLVLCASMVALGVSLERPEATLQAKFQKQKATGAQSPTVSSITCDAARAVVADYGFKDVKPDLCVGKTLRFRATRDGKEFLIEIAANGDLARVRRYTKARPVPSVRHNSAAPVGTPFSFAPGDRMRHCTGLSGTPMVT